ncbi:MAG: hypothetical protein OEM82_04525, partial [Acidobacteriota bacterium]|nr:hypothetical protein [Acidobacteriota bacterium]
VKTQFSYDQDKLTRFRYAKREMGSRSRSIITSGDRPVYDSVSLGDGTISDHSPFAIAFLEALRTDGGELEVLTIAGIKLKIDGLEIRPQIGRLSGTDGEFAFVKRDKRAMKTESD